MPHYKFIDPVGAVDRHSVVYYPVFLDVAELKGLAETDAKPGSEGVVSPGEADKISEEYPGQSRRIFDASELLDIAVHYDCSAVQTLVLLLKNTFEGHCYLSFGLTAEAMIRQGMFRLNPADDIPYDFSIHFIDHLDVYVNGLQEAWVELQILMPHVEGICFESLLLFLIATNLYRLPLSTLTSLDIGKFQHFSGREKRFYQLYLTVSTYMNQAVFDLAVIDQVAKRYDERFRESLIRLTSRNNLLIQMKTKLLYANDPLIRTTEELEQRYFSFLIEKEIVRDTGKVVVKHVPWEEDIGAEEQTSVLRRAIKNLFRVISKNCKEAFTAGSETTQGFDATRFFLDVNAIFNEPTTDVTDQLIQYYQLINLFIQVYNTRRIHALPAIFPDNATLETTTIWGPLNEETVRECKRAVAEKISLLNERNHTEFKWKHISDDELATIHETYLNKQIEFLDQRIQEILEEINRVMQGKSVRSSIQ